MFHARASGLIGTARCETIFFSRVIPSTSTFLVVALVCGDLSPHVSAPPIYAGDPIYLPSKSHLPCVTVKRGTGMIVAGASLALQGIASHLAAASLSTSGATSSGPSGMGELAIWGLNVLTVVSLASALPPLAIGSHRRARWHAQQARCLGAAPHKPRPRLGFSLLAAGTAVLIGTAISGTYFRPDCTYCRSVVAYSGTTLGISLVLPGWVLSNYARGYLRWR